MAATVSVNDLTVVHQASGGVSNAFPDVCKTPTPAGPVPIPYPNIAMSSDTADGSKTLTADGNPIMLKGSNFCTSTGDEAGAALGVASNRIKGKACPASYSFDVKVEGDNVFRLTDLMLQNSGSPPNTPPGPEAQAPLLVIGPQSEPLPTIVSVEWNPALDAKCGDPIEILVTTSNYPPGSIVSVSVFAGTPSGLFGPDPDQPVIANEIAPVEGNQAKIQWITRTGPSPRNPTPLSLWAYGAGDSKLSGASLKITVPDEAEKEVPKSQRMLPRLVQVMVPEQNPDGSWTTSNKFFPVVPAAFWGWDFGYHLAIKDGVIKVTGKLKLVPQNGVTFGDKEKKEWKAEIEDVWNKRQWREHRTACQRGKECDCPGGCCLFNYQFVCEFVDGGEYAAVDVWPNNPDSYGYPPHVKWWNSATWFITRCGHEGNGIGVRAHEFGHTIGMYDEYPTGAVFVPTDAKGNVSGQPPYPSQADSLMGLGGKNNINANYLEDFYTWFEGANPDYNLELRGT